MGQSYRTDGPGVSSSHPLHFLSSHPHHDLVSGGDSRVSIKEMENKKHNPTSTAATGNQCFALTINASKRRKSERVLTSLTQRLTTQSTEKTVKDRQGLRVSRTQE